MCDSTNSEDYSSGESTSSRSDVASPECDGASFRLPVLFLAATALMAGCQSSSDEPSARQPEDAAVESEPPADPAGSNTSNDDDTSEISPDDTEVPGPDDPLGEADVADNEPPVQDPTEEPTDTASLPLPVQISLEVIPDKTIQIEWQSSESAGFYRVLENPDGISGYTPISEDLAAPIQSFEHRVALYNRLNARYIVQACNQSGCADSTEQSVLESLDRAVGYFKADNSAEQIWFGSYVAHSGDGNTLAVAASTGVYVFARSSGIWMQQAFLESDGRGFRGAIDLSQDGHTLAVGAASHDGAASDVDGDRLDSSGAAYVFKRDDGLWQQYSVVTASNAGATDNFGRSLSLSADGTFLAIGATGEDSDSTGVDGGDNDSGRNHGAAYVFVLEDGNWQQEAYLKSTRNGNNFGWSMDLSARGETLVVGEGSAINVFVREDGGWQQQFFQEVQGGSLFSLSVSVSGDGSLLAVGSPSHSLPENSSTRTGEVFVYERLDGDWRQQTSLRASNPPFSNSGVIKVGDRFGESVSLSADGNTVAVGAPFEESAATGFNGDQNDDSLYRSGAAYVFARSDGSWAQKAYVKSVNSHALQSFGTSVSLGADGESLAIGAPREHSDASGIDGDRFGFGNPDSGAVFLY